MENVSVRSVWLDDATKRIVQLDLTDGSTIQVGERSVYPGDCLVTLNWPVIVTTQDGKVWRSDLEFLQGLVNSYAGFA